MSSSKLTSTETLARNPLALWREKRSQALSYVSFLNKKLRYSYTNQEVAMQFLSATNRIQRA